MAHATHKQPSEDLHVIFGTGPVGCWTTHALVAEGRWVRAVNRSGRRPELLPEGVELRTADASDPAQAIAAAEAAAAGVAPKASAMGYLMMWAGGLFIPGARASLEMMDQFVKPFVVDAHAFERTFGLPATPLREGLARTVAWYAANAA